MLQFYAAWGRVVPLPAADSPIGLGLSFLEGAPGIVSTVGRSFSPFCFLRTYKRVILFCRFVKGKTGFPGRRVIFWILYQYFSHIWRSRYPYFPFRPRRTPDYIPQTPPFLAAFRYFTPFFQFSSCNFTGGVIKFSRNKGSSWHGSFRVRRVVNTISWEIRPAEEAARLCCDHLTAGVSLFCSPFHRNSTKILGGKYQCRSFCSWACWPWAS